jgi:hypothetical protein
VVQLVAKLPLPGLSQRMEAAPQLAAICLDPSVRGKIAA